MIAENTSTSLKLLNLRLAANYKNQAFEIGIRISEKINKPLFDLFYFYSRFLYNMAEYLIEIMTTDTNDYFSIFNIKFNDNNKSYFNIVFKNSEYYTEQFCDIWSSFIHYSSDHALQSIEKILTQEDIKKDRVATYNKMADVIFLYSIHIAYLVKEIDAHVKFMNNEIEKIDLIYDDFTHEYITGFDNYIQFRKSIYTSKFNIHQDSHDDNIYIISNKSDSIKIKD